MVSLPAIAPAAPPSRTRDRTAGQTGRLLFATFLLGTLVAGCEATHNPLAGMGNVAGSFSLGNRQIPLPDGDWHEAARRAYKSRLGVALTDTVLIRSDRHRVDGVVLITTNRRAGGERGWRRAAFCDAAAPRDREIHANRTGGKQDCWALQHGPTGLRDPKDPTLAKLADYAAHDGLALFDTGATIRYRLAGNRDLMQVSYFFDSPAAARPMMRRWAESWHVKVRLGYHGILDQRPAPSIAPVASIADPAQSNASTALDDRTTRIGLALPSPGLPLAAVRGIIGDVPRDDAVTLDLIHKNFGRVVFQTEYGGPVGWVRKWNTHPVIRYQKDFDPAAIAALRETVGTLAAVTGLRLKLRPVAPDYFDRRGEHFIRDNITLLRPTDGNIGNACYGEAKFARDGSVVVGAVYISPGFDFVPVRECVMEEFAQLLGPMNDTALIHQSLFNDQTNGIVSWLTWYDAILLRTLYDERLQPGMPKDEAMPIARRIIRSLLAELNRRPPRHLSFGAAPVPR